MTRRTTLFLVCAFEIALLLFMAAWSAQAREVYVFHCNLNLTHDVTVDGKTTIHKGGSTDFTMKLEQNRLSFASSKSWIDKLEMRVSWLHDEYSFRAYGDETTNATSLALGGGDFALTSTDQWYTSVSYGSCKLLD